MTAFKGHIPGERISGSLAFEQSGMAEVAGQIQLAQEPQRLTSPIVGPTDLAVTSGTSPPTKVCTACLESKLVTEFYRKASALESQCKVCKKSKRQSRAKPDPRVPQKISIESTNSSLAMTKAAANPDSAHFSLPTPHIEPRTSLTFDLWERRYGRILTESEKLEIKSNLTAYFKLLLQEGLGSQE